MTLDAFNRLHQHEQIDLLYKEGTYVGKRRIAAQVVVLYQLESFYVEIFYKQYRRLVTRLHGFRSTELLSPYLEGIDVEELMNVH